MRVKCILSSVANVVIIGVLVIGVLGLYFVEISRTDCRAVKGISICGDKDESDPNLVKVPPW